MPVEAIPQMFEHRIDFLKGWWSPHAVDFVGKLDPAIDPSVGVVTSGRVVHVSANTPRAGGAGVVDSIFRLGCVGQQVAIFLIPGEADNDVQNFGNGAVNPYGWNPVMPSGDMSGLVATGAYELQSTEVDDTDGVVFQANDYLHSPTEEQITGADKSAAGMIFNARNWPGGDGGDITQYGSTRDNIIGIVSRGECLNHYRRRVVSFWPYHAAGSAADR